MVSTSRQLDTSYEINCKSRFRYYLRIFFNLMDSTAVNVHAIYEKKVNAKMSLLNFKITFAESLINRLPSRKRKVIAEEL